MLTSVVILFALPGAIVVCALHVCRQIGSGHSGHSVLCRMKEVKVGEVIVLVGRSKSGSCLSICAILPQRFQDCLRVATSAPITAPGVHWACHVFLTALQAREGCDQRGPRPLPLVRCFCVLLHSLHEHAQCVRTIQTFKHMHTQ